MTTKKHPELAVAPPADLTFEEALSRLEEVVARLEGGRQPLEVSLKDFEDGMRLVRFCSSQLDETEKRIEVLVKDARGRSEFAPLASSPQDE